MYLFAVYDIKVYIYKDYNIIKINKVDEFY